MSQLDTILYNMLPMPIDICNIIITYANDVEQVYTITTGIRYKYNDKLYDYSNTQTACIINNTLCSIKIDIFDKYLLHINDIIRYRFNIACYVIKYSNGLVCEHNDCITIYNIKLTTDSLVLTERCSRRFLTTRSILLYADYRYIITKNIESYGLSIYDSNLLPIKTIITVSPVCYVAMLNNKLYYLIYGQSHLIDL